MVGPGGGDGMKSNADETASLALFAGAALVLLAHAASGLATPGPSVGWSAVRVRLVTQGASPATGCLVLVAVLVILLTPGDEIARPGQIALRIGVVVSAITFLAAVLGASSIASQQSTLQIWASFVMPRLITAVPAGIAARLAMDALRGN